MRAGADEDAHMWAWGLTVTMSLIVLAGAVAGFGYAGSAGWIAATRRPGIGKYGLRALVAVLIGWVRLSSWRWRALGWAKELR